MGAMWLEKYSNEKIKQHLVLYVNSSQQSPLCRQCLQASDVTSNQTSYLGFADEMVLHYG